MRVVSLVALFAACAPVAGEDAVEKLPGSPFPDETSERGTTGGSGFVPARFGIGATWGVEGGELAAFERPGGRIEDPEVILHLLTWSFLEEGDDAGRCTVTYKVEEADPLTNTFDHETFTTRTRGPWTAHGFLFELDADNATTTCTGLDPVVWGDPVDLLDGAVLGIGTTEANDDIREVLVASQRGVDRHAGAAVQWDLFTRYEALTSDTYQTAASAYYPDGVVEPGTEAIYTPGPLDDGAYFVEPVLVLLADALLVALD